MATIHWCVYLLRVFHFSGVSVNLCCWLRRSFPTMNIPTFRKSFSRIFNRWKILHFWFMFFLLGKWHFFSVWFKCICTESFQFWLKFDNFWILRKSFYVTFIIRILFSCCLENSFWQWFMHTNKIIPPSDYYCIWNKL